MADATFRLVDERALVQIVGDTGLLAPFVAAAEAAAASTATDASVAAASAAAAEAAADGVQAAIDTAVANLPAEFQGDIGPMGSMQVNGLPFVVASVVADGVTSDHAAINGALAQGDIVLLPAGTIALSSPILLTSGKTLIGAGRGKTILKLLPGSATPGGMNAAVAANTAQNVRLCDLTVDVNKVGLGGGLAARRNGVMMYRTTGFDVERVETRNATGYAMFAQDDTYSGNCSGVFRDSGVINSEIHYEQMGCDGVVLENCTSGDGDGDIACQSWLHPLSASRNIFYRGFRGRGTTAAGVEITSNIATMFNLWFSDVVCDVLGGGIGFVANGSGAEDVVIDSSEFTSAGYLGGNIGYASGRINNSKFAGIGVGLTFNGGAMEWEVGGTEARGTAGPGVVAYAIEVISGAKVRWVGGHLYANGGGGSIPITGGGSVSVSQATKVTPFGGGYRLPPRTLDPAGVSTTSTTGATVNEGGSEPWSFPVEAGRRYRVSIRGSWLHASSAANGIVAVEGSGGTAGTLRGSLTMGRTETEQVEKVISGYAGAADPASRIDAAMPVVSAFLPLRGEFVFACSAAGTIAIKFATSDGAQPMSIGGLSSLEVVEV